MRHLLSVCHWKRTFKERKSRNRGWYPTIDSFQFAFQNVLSGFPKREGGPRCATKIVILKIP